MTTKTPLKVEAVREMVGSAFSEELHAKQAYSLGNAALGLIHGSKLSSAGMGRALAAALDLEPKHAIKQIDRFLGNARVDVAQLQRRWVPFVIAERKEIVVAMDWTDFDADGQTTLAISMMTSHGRATPLMWQSVKKTSLKNRRNLIEDELLERFREAVPQDVKVTVLADRGFGDKVLYEYLQGDLRFGFVIRFRGSIQVTNADGVRRPASGWLSPSGRAIAIRHAAVTADQVSVGTVVTVKAKGMKDAWYLACSDTTMSASDLIKLYGKRFTIEETFRDAKNGHLGMGLSEARISTPERRDRLLLVNAVAVALLTLLGAAGESLGWDRKLKANTEKKRTHSLLFQGTYYYDALQNMRPERADPLIQRFGELVLQHGFLSEMLGLI